MNKEFLKPQSMITPGIAGGFVVLIGNSLVTQFELPFPWTILGLSFLLGLLVFLATTTPLWQRMIYYVVNALIIFSVAAGATHVASKATLDYRHAADTRATASGAEANPAQLAQLEKLKADRERNEKSLSELRVQLMPSEDFAKLDQLKAEIDRTENRIRQAKSETATLVMDPDEVAQSEARLKKLQGDLERDKEALSALQAKLPKTEDLAQWVRLRTELDRTVASIRDLEPKNLKAAPATAETSEPPGFFSSW